MSGSSPALLRHFVVLQTLVFAWAYATSAQVMQGPTTIRQNVHHDVSLPLSEMVKNAPPSQTMHHEAEPARPIPLPAGLAVLDEDPVRQALTPAAPSPAVGLSFEGLGQGQYGFNVQWAPPDPNGAAGATQYVQWVNTSFAVFDKTSGAKLLGPVAGNTLWSGFGGSCQTNNDGDPVVVYDKLADRWVMSQFSVSTPPYLQCIAVSQTSDATGAWYRYSFQYSTYDDYPKMGVWPDAYYETFNMFVGQTLIGADACAYDRNNMLAGQSATQICFQQGAFVGGLLPSDLDGNAPPPTGSPNYMMYFGANTLNLYKFHVDFTTPSNSTFTGPRVINVAAFSPLCGGGTCVVQPGTTQKVDSLGDRLMYRLAYRNFGSHESLVVNHSVAAGTSGGIRWYEIQNPSGTPVVAQQSTYAPDSAYRWMGSVAMDQAGNLAVGYSKSSSSNYPSIAFAGRLATDPVNTLQSETAVVAGTGSEVSGLSRWGDYSSLTVDPVDDCTFWYTQMYLKTNGMFNWNTRIANFKFANCGSQLNLNPTSLTFGSQVVGTSSMSQAITVSNSGTGTVTGISISASGDFSETDNCGTSLGQNASCIVNVTFTPSVVGALTGTLTVNDSTETQSVSLSGTGVWNASLTPVTVNFGNQTYGVTSNPQPVTLGNSQTSALTGISVSITGANAGDFAQTNNCGTSLAGNSSCTINVTFTPAGFGARSATLRVTDSAGTQTSALMGTGQDTSPPTTQITAPANNSTLSNNVTVTATAADNVGVSSIQIFVDGAIVASGTSSPLNYTWVTTLATNGPHTIYSTASDAAGNVGTSSTITVTVNNSVSQLLQNTGFEIGNLAYWNASGIYLPFVTTARHNSGSYSALLGSSTTPEPHGDSSLYQTVTIPSSSTAASLTFYYWGACADTIANDWQEAQVQNASGTMLGQIMKVCDNSQTWTKMYFNLLPYKGQTIRIYFNDHSNGNGLLTYMYLDDVTVSVKGVTVTLSPGSLTFGTQDVGTTSSSQPLTLANIQSSALTGVSVSITGTNAGDFTETDNCGTSVAANSSCTINVTFSPTAAGARSATLTVTDSAGTQTASLSGTGVANVTLTPTNGSFGNQIVGTSSAPQPLTLTDGSTSSLSGVSVSISGTNAGDFAQTNNCGTWLAANSSCTINVTFTPTALGARTATLTVTDSAGTQTATLTGTGVGNVSLTPSSLSYGNQNLGTTSSSQPLTLTNSTGSAITGVSVSVAGTNSGDYAQTNNCGTTLAASSSCIINVTFTPTAAGIRTATLTATDSAGTQTSSLSGTGVGNVTLAPPSVGFANQGVGTTSSQQPLTLTNGNPSALTGISVSVTGTNAGDYAQTNNCGTTIAASSSCTINVTFTPAGYGARSATLTVNDSAGTQTSSLTGTGTDITAPTTQITTPANNATVSNTVTVTATASDNVGVTSIQIYVDGTQVASGTTSPLNYSWNTANASNGTHTIFSKASDAAGNVGTSTTITVTVSNGVQQLLLNTGFETGNLANWFVSGLYLPFVTNARKNSGSYSAQLGASVAPELISDSAIYQIVTIPNTSVGASLNFYYWGSCADTVANDWQEVQIQNALGVQLAQVMKVCDNNKTWTKVYFNLMNYKGQTIRIYFNTHQNGNGLLTYMNVDDVTVSVK